jgi:hypothetical protein
MAEHQQQPVVPNGPSDRERFVDALCVIAFGGVLMAVCGGIYGWEGRGLVGEWTGPGLSGLIFGVLGGMMFGTALMASAIWLTLWVFQSLSRFIVAALISWALILFFLIRRYIESGWTGVLPAIVLFASCGLIAFLANWVQRRSRVEPSHGSKVSPGAKEANEDLQGENGSP